MFKSIFFKNIFLRISICLLLTIIAIGQRKVVKLTDGRELVGEVTKTENGYDVKAKYGVISVVAGDVVSIEDAQPTPEELYEQKLSKIEEDSPTDHLELGRWALENDLLEESQEQLVQALELKSDLIEAEILLRQVKARLADKKKKPTTRPKTVLAELQEGWLISQDDIYSIRLEELREGENVSILYKNKVLNRFIEMMAGVDEFGRPRMEDRFRRWPRTRQVLYMLDAVGPDSSDIKDDILIRTDPRFMLEFRSQVWPVISRNCASSGCHGAERPLGGFKLFNIPGKFEQIDYTNFVILDGFVSHGRRMIDRGRNDQSLLLEYGLPRKQATFKHPDVPGFVPPFTSRRSSRYLRLLDWISSLNGPPHPEYGLQYKPPFGMNLDWTATPQLPSEDTKEEKTEAEAAE